MGASEHLPASRLLHLDPASYHRVSPYDLLHAVACGYIGLDHRILHAILDRRAEAVPALVRFGMQDHESDPLNLESDLVDILRYLRAPEAIPFYIKLVRDTPDDVSDDLIDAFVGAGPTALEPLLQLYEELGEENAGDVGFLLGALKIHDPRVLKILTDRLEYDVSDAALCLDVYGDPAAIPALEEMLQQIPESDESLRRELLDVIENLKKPPEASDREVVFDIWPLYPAKAGPVFDVLSEADRVEMLDTPHAELRAEAASSFVNSELSDRAKSRLIQLAKMDPDAKVRGHAWEALADQTEEPEIRRALFAVIADTTKPLDERAGAIVALSRHSDNLKVQKAIEDLYSEPGGRARAMEAMWRSFDRKYAAYPPRHLDDPDPEVRRQAIWGVGQLGLTQEAPRLRAFFEQEEFRPDALFNYALAAPGEISRGRAQALLEKIEKLGGGLTPGEGELVERALDQRLMSQGMKPVFDEELAAEWENEQEPPATSVKPGRNDPCPCGSGKKYKKCCGA